ncbi:hypothetical protein niasHS_010328 [Heterodera schachtii]|uniref:Uncharacterized protein n=1 Tax=Heterodera schachtii TaxID=97005 RepID=A0ABD2IZF7_HETSC
MKRNRPTEGGKTKTDGRTEDTDQSGGGAHFGNKSRPITETKVTFLAYLINAPPPLAKRNFCGCGADFVDDRRWSSSSRRKTTSSDGIEEQEKQEEEREEESLGAPSQKCFTPPPARPIRLEEKPPPPGFIPSPVTVAAPPLAGAAAGQMLRWFRETIHSPIPDNKTGFPAAADRGGDVF